MTIKTHKTTKTQNMISKIHKTTEARHKMTENKDSHNNYKKTKTKIKRQEVTAKIHSATKTTTT